MFEKLLKGMEYSEEEIKNIKNKCVFSSRRDKFLYSNYLKVHSFFVAAGYTDEQVKMMVKSFPNICSYSVESLKSLIYWFIENGYVTGEIIIMTLHNPRIYSQSALSFDEKISYFLELGYAKEQIFEMFLEVPGILSLSNDDLKQKINALKEIGFSDFQIIKIISIIPQIYSYSVSNLKKKISSIQDLGYTKDEVLKIVLELPSIFSLSIDNLQEKISYYREIGIGQIVLENPKQLMQSVDMTYARYRYLTEVEHMAIDYDNCHRLFMGSKTFEKKYNINKSQLLEMYSYDEDRRQSKEARKTKIKP